MEAKLLFVDLPGDRLGVYLWRRVSVVRRSPGFTRTISTTFQNMSRLGFDAIFPEQLCCQVSSVLFGGRRRFRST